MSAMTSNQIMLVRAIANNDMPKARAYARICVKEDDTKKNAMECKQLARLLDPVQNPDLEKLPYRIEGMLEAEDPRKSFPVDRYYLSPREAELYTRIDRDRKVCQELMDMRIRRTNTTLVHGESGTGKTTFGRFVAAMFGLPFYYVNFSRLIDSLMGKTAQNLAAIFDYVRTVPCVLMLDEIDTVSTSRTGGGDSVANEFNRITVTLMQEFDRMLNTQVVVGATNRLDIIDPALLRRFSRVHEIKVPQDEIEASRVVKLLLDDCGIGYDRDNLVDFCSEHPGRSQAWLIGSAIDEIAATLAVRQVMAETGNDDLVGELAVHFES